MLNGLQPSDVSPNGADAAHIFDLSRGQLKAQIKQFLL
jgi:hypothetical protein